MERVQKRHHRFCHRGAGGRHLPELQWLRRTLFAVELHPAVCGVSAAHRYPYLGKHQRGQLHRRCGRPFRQSGSGDHWHLPAGLQDRVRHLRHRRCGVHRCAAGLPVVECQALQPADGRCGQPRYGLFHRHAVAQVRPPVRLPAGGYRVHRRWQFGHSEDQPEAFSAHLDLKKHPDPSPRPCAQAQGLE